MSIQRVEVFGQQLVLHPEKAMYWETQNLLLIGDLHLGKAAHFRKNGIAVSHAVMDANFDRLSKLMAHFDPGGVLFLGDLFHSDYNLAWEYLVEWMKNYPDCRFELVQGNHDSLSDELYQRAGLHVYQEPLHYPPFYFTHHPMEDVPADGYNLAGHIHPGVFLKGLARQRVKLPCFWFGPNQGLIPAFGTFTGLGIIQIKAEDRVFVVAEESVIPIQ
ncbi:MAG: ligase-associated DNA damage response endonuclease PdeM [Bacteroidota bacterium]